MRRPGLRVVFVVFLWLAAATQHCAAQDAPPSFSQWLDGVRAEALSRNIRQEIVEQALAGIQEPLTEVISRDLAQPEKVMPIDTYVSRRLRPATVRTAREMLLRYGMLLNRISKAYGVPSSVIVAVWGLESNFGHLNGDEPTVGALTTLAWDSARADFFRQELFSALEILNRGDIELSQMRGSWAGAMGQLQFLPSSYLEYAVDFDGDGRPDIWGSPADIFASIAHYLERHGWETGRPWGYEVRAPRDVDKGVERRNGGCQAIREMTVALPLREWQHRGVRLRGGQLLPRTNTPASLVSTSRRSFLVFDNYDALLSYNCAHAYALSVGLLADRIAH